MMRRALVLLLFAASACGNSESARVTIDLAALYQHAAQTPASIDRVELTVVGEGVDLDPVTVDRSTLEFEVEVPAGRARTFAIEAWQENAAGGSERLTTYWGAATHDLAPRTEVDITIPIVPAGRVFGTVSLPNDAAVPADVDLTFTASSPRSVVAGVLTATASNGAFSVPLPAGQYSVTASVAVGGTTYRLPPGTTVDILQGQLTGPVDLALVESSAAAQVTVTVADHGSPLPDVAVLLNAADGTFKSQTATDPSGIALLDAASGDMVTVAYAGTQYQNDAFTVVGVEPGDVLPFEVGVSDQMQQPIGTLTVAMEVPYGGASNHTASVGCGQGILSVTTPAVLSVYDECVRSGDTVDLIVTAEDRNGGVLATYTATGLPARGENNVTVDAWNDSAAAIAMNVDVANASDLGASNANIQIALRRNGVEYSVGGMSGYLAAPDWPTFTATVPTGFFQTVDVKVSTWGTASAGEIRERFVSDTWPAAVTADFAGLLPAVTGVAVDETNPARPDVSWTTAAEATEFDVTLLRVNWYDVSSLTWNLTLPPGTQTPLTLPEIPATLPGFQPQTYPNAQAAQVELVDYSFLTGYGAWVSQVGPQELADHAKDFWPQDPATSRRTQGL